jgi:hypothetical protein
VYERCREDDACGLAIASSGSATPTMEATSTMKMEPLDGGDAELKGSVYLLVQGTAQRKALSVVVTCARAAPPKHPPCAGERAAAPCCQRAYHPW